MSIKHARHSQRKRPALYWAVLELASLADAWLDMKTARLPGCRNQVLSGLRRAFTALTHASAGSQVANQIARMRSAMNDCEAGFMLLHHRIPKIVEEARRRIDQILATLDQLEKLEPGEWLKVDLSPLSNDESDGSCTDPVAAALREIAQRVSLWIPAIVKTDAHPESQATGPQGPAPPTATGDAEMESGEEEG